MNTRQILLSLHPRACCYSLTFMRHHLCPQGGYLHRPTILARQKLDGNGILPIRNLATAVRQRRDDIWIPTINLKKHDGALDATELLTQAGYLRQAYSGVYHMLPLGLIVQNKLEKLIDKHMRSIQASKISLSSISSQALWQKSGRLNAGSEFFKFSDRKGSKWLLAPTHEEEITQLAAEVINSPSQLPVRVYQVSRKYRDEKRPRGGLLRGREFIMKDLYTFDISQADAHNTYDQVRQAYRNFLTELKVPYVEARADSGNMGGNLSHEYHFPSVAGEDDVIHCTSCDYARNEEWVSDCPHTVGNEVMIQGERGSEETQQLISQSYIDRSRTQLVKAYAPQRTAASSGEELNAYAVKAAAKVVVELDTGVEEIKETFLKTETDPVNGRKMVYYLFDSSTNYSTRTFCIDQDKQWRDDHQLDYRILSPNLASGTAFSLLKQMSGDSCPQCKTGVLQVDKAIEVGHTFHLGTRYSSKLGLTVRHPQKGSEPTLVEMGCHGVGVSRLIAAVASAVSDSTGLNWPAVIAPYHAAIVVDGNDIEKRTVAENLYDATSKATNGEVEVLLDDRTSVNNGYKLKDADLIGYPIILIVGKTWQQTRQIEVQCRKLGIKENVELEQIPSFVTGLIQRL